MNAKNAFNILAPQVWSGDMIVMTNVINNVVVMIRGSTISV